MSDRSSYKFDDFVLDAGKRTLSCGANRVPLPSKAFDTLVYLVRNCGQVVEKADLMSAVWPDTAVEENNLNQNISLLRRVLGDARGENRFIATVPGRGYCFTAKVNTLTGSEERSRTITICVLPFDNLMGSAERAYLADGLMEETIATLGQLDPNRLSVIGRTTAIVAKRSGKSLAEIGRDLGAAYLIESSLRGENNLLRVTSRLVRVEDQSQIWSATYDRELTSLLALQRELSITLAKQVLLQLAPDRIDSLAHRQTQDPAAYDLYLRGRYHWNQFAPLATRRATEFFARATEIDPNYALAWSGLADALISSPVSGDLPALSILPRAREAAQNAMRSDPSLAESQTSMGFYEFWFGWNWTASIAAYESAIAADPGYAFAHRMLGIVLSHARRHDAAMASIRRARELDLLNAMNHALSSQVAFAARDLDAAEMHAREAITLDPEFWIGHFQLAQALAARRKDSAAFDALNQANRFSNANSKTLGLRGWLFAVQGKVSEAKAILSTIDSAARERHMPPYAAALIHCGLGDEKAALDALALSYDQRDVHLAFLTIDSKWDPLREHPRFRQLLSDCGFMENDQG